VLCVSLFSGCGYRFQHYTQRFFSGNKTVSVGTIYNATAIKSGSIILGEKIRDELVDAGLPVELSGNGKFVVKGKITDFREKPVGFSPDRFGLEYEVVIRSELEVVDVESGETWMDGINLVGEATYYSGVNSSYTRTNRERAIEAALQGIAERFARKLAEAEH